MIVQRMHIVTSKPATSATDTRYTNTARFTKRINQPATLRGVAEVSSEQHAYRLGCFTRYYTGAACEAASSPKVHIQQ